MPRYVNDGNIKVAWGTFADKNFIALSELGAADDIECHLTKDGLGITFNENEVEDGALCETFDATLPGSYGVQIELTMKRRNTDGGDTDVAWDLFNTRGETGALVVRRGIDADVAWQAGQPVEVYPGTVGVRQPVAPASNEQARFMVRIYGSEEPALDAEVVAS
ncbi:MAG TPA: hypothetical protein VKZ72_01925 [Acidimicrobiales bacterium]|nr:hypothetical protein [Acidimicrobiales bacterium]